MMVRTLNERLEEARRQQFVGRTSEQELIRQALTADDLPFVLLYVFGPGGVGKTSLLRTAAHLAQQAGVKVLTLDGRNFEPSPTAFLHLLQQQLGCPTPDAVFSTLADSDGRYLLLVDTAELLSPLDGWLRDNFLPQLSANVLVIIAGRNPPSLRWRSDPGWQQLMHVLPLHNLTQEESRALLAQRRVPAQEHEAVLRFTHGNPLALSLVADVFAQQPGTPFRPEKAPDVIKTLLEQFMQDAPSPDHRAALEASSQVRLLNEPLLGAILEVDDPHPLFNWLRTLSFMDAEPRGLFPHDLAREALAADLHWRNPVRQAALHDRARKYYVERFHVGDAREQRQVLSDYIFLHRDNPVIRPYFEWQSTGTVFTDIFRPEDKEAILGMVAEHEGTAARRIASHWLARQPNGVVVLRQADGVPRGVLIMVSLDKTDEADRALDPGTAAAWNYLKAYAPLRAGETATLFRFWMAADTYQAVSPVQSRIFLNMVQHYLTVPGLAFTLIPCADPDFWTAVFGFADLHRLPEADFSVEGRHLGVYGHDWRVVPPLAWLDLLAKRELGEAAVPTSASTLPDVPESAVYALDEKGFAAAVHNALRNYGDVVALANNPLLNSRLLNNALPPESTTSRRIETLQNILRETADSLQNTPRRLKFYKALHHTYFQPAVTQEKAAELLDLPFSTYRRHLRSGIDYVTERLWQRELNRPGSNC